MKKLKLINNRPLFTVSLSLCAGTIFCFYTHYHNVSPFILLLLLTVPQIMLLFFQNIKKALIFTLIFLAFFALGAFFLNLQIKTFERAKTYEQTCTIQGTVIKSAKINDYNLLVLSSVTINGEKSSHKIRVYNYDETANLKDIVKFNATLKYTENLSNNTYFLINNIRYQASCATGKLEVTNSSKNIFLTCKSALINTLYKTLNSDYAALGSALITGETDGLDQTLLSNFRYSGVAHIFSVSGLHIATLAGALLLIFGRIKYNNFLKPTIITAILLFFSGICGFSPSSVRATIMCAVFIFSKSFGKRRDSLNALFLAFIIVVMLNPASMFGIGFLLSFTVVLFIILLNKNFAMAFSFLPKKLSSALNISLSATLSSLPLINSAFGYISILTLLVNLIFIPLVSLAFTVTLFAAIFVTIIPFTAIILKIPELLLKICHTIFIWLNFKPFILEGLVFSFSVILYFLALVTLSDKINLKPKTRLFTFVITLSLFIISFIFINALPYTA